MAHPIVEDYSSSLTELTFNSRPIIDNLTIIAKENTDHAEGISQAISNRIYKCIPEQKLFALYLLDSVCKIVGAPYTQILGAEIFKIFSHVYLLVGESTRAKLIKMYELWRVTKPKGTINGSLFPAAQLDRIGDFLRQAGYRKTEAIAVSATALPNNEISAVSLVADIDALVPALERKLAADPNDGAVKSKLSALEELRVLLLSQRLSPQDLRGISDRLAPMKSQELFSRQGAASGPGNPADYRFNGVASVSKPLVTGNGDTVGNISPAQTNGIQITSRAEVLFNNLVASGLIKVDQSLKPGSKPEYELILPKHKYSPGMSGLPSTNALEQLLQDANLAEKSQYEQIKFKELVKVSKLVTGAETPIASSLQKFVTTNVLDAATVQVLYETKSSKCAQCGKRFTTDDQGAAKKRLHLDWHFRINQKQANYKTNIQSRNWYLDDFAWVIFRDDDLLEYESMTQKKKETPTPAAEPAHAYVVIPSNESNTTNMCIICREQVKPTFNDSLGEWVWDSCVLAPGSHNSRKIVHLSCFEEASRKRSADADGDRVVKREKWA